MKPLTGKNFIKILEQKGWVLKELMEATTFFLILKKPKLSPSRFIKMITLRLDCRKN